MTRHLENMGVEEFTKLFDKLMDALSACLIGI